MYFQNYRSAEEIVQDDEETDGTSKSDRPTLEMLQQQLEQTNRLCQTLMGDQTAPQMAAPQMARVSVSGKSLEQMGDQTAPQMARLAIGFWSITFQSSV